MNIQNRTSMIIFNLLIGVLAALATWLQFVSFGHDAWRLFSTWAALVATIYYAVDTAAMFLIKRRIVGSEIWPMLQGGLIVSGITLILFQIIGYAMDSYTPNAGFNGIVTNFLLPVLMIISWVLFSTKGKWRAYDPFYWLALPAVYCALILVSGELMSRSARLVYPYEFLNYPSIGIDTMLWWCAILATVILTVGYIFWILDFAFSGKLSQYIVMPKIKTVIIEEEVEEETEPAEVSEKPEEKPVKLVTTGARNLLTAKSQAKQESKTKTDVDGSKANAKKSNSSSTTLKSKATNKPTNNTPPVRIIEKIEISPTKSNQKNPKTKSESAKEKEVVIQDGKKSIKTKDTNEKTAVQTKPSASPKAKDTKPKDVPTKTPKSKSNKTDEAQPSVTP